MSLDLTQLQAQVADELRKAQGKFPGFHSAHEGYAVILEELEELWDEIKKRPSELRRDLMRLEAIQVAAMAMRFIIDVEGDK